MISAASRSSSVAVAAVAPRCGRRGVVADALLVRGLGPPSGVADCLAAVFRVNIDGSGLTQITPYGQDIAATDWSPDGTKLVLESSFE